tara:strand:- start:5384 stop:5896 length:513 start_codon:yes stop_codon:yes gene_type:complete
MDIILSIIMVVILIVTIIILVIKKNNFIPKEEKIQYTPQNSVLTIFEMLLLDEINGHRRSMGISQIKPERLCRDLAYNHTKDMINEGCVSYDNSIERKYELFRRESILCEESVSYGYSTAKSFFIAYIKNEKHRKLIESHKFTHIGVRALQDTNKKYYNTLIFCEFAPIH